MQDTQYKVLIPYNTNDNLFWVDSSHDSFESATKKLHELPEGRLTCVTTETLVIKRRI